MFQTKEAWAFAKALVLTLAVAIFLWQITIFSLYFSGKRDEAILIMIVGWVFLGAMILAMLVYWRRNK